MAVDKLSDAEVMVLCQVQLESFREEVMQARKREVLPSSSKILPISPVLGSDGLPCGKCRSRLADNIAWEASQPVILPRKHQVTKTAITQGQTKS